LAVGLHPFTAGAAVPNDVETVIEPMAVAIFAKNLNGAFHGGKM
jgi:hypothetical protein